MAAPSSDDRIRRSGLTAEQQDVLRWDFERLQPGYSERPDAVLTIKAKADQIGRNEQTVRNWMRSERYQVTYEEISRHIIAAPERLMRLADKLYEMASSGEGDRQAVNDYLALVNRINPPKPLERERADLADMDDEAMFRLIVDAAGLRRWTVRVFDEKGDPVAFTTG